MPEQPPSRSPKAIASEPLLENWTDGKAYRKLLDRQQSIHQEMENRAGAIRAKRTVLEITTKLFNSKPANVSDQDFRKHLDCVLSMLTKPAEVTESTYARVDDYLARNGFQFAKNGKPASFFNRPQSRASQELKIAKFREYHAQHERHLKIFADWACDNLGGR